MGTRQAAVGHHWFSIDKPLFQARRIIDISGMGKFKTYLEDKTTYVHLVDAIWLKDINQ